MTTPHATDPADANLIVTGKGVLTGALSDAATVADPKNSDEFAHHLRIHHEGGELHVWATDRRHGIHVAVPAEGSGLPGVLHVRADEIKGLCSVLRSSKTVWVTAKKDVVIFSDGVDAVALRLRPVVFPPLPNALTSDPIGDPGEVQVGPEFLSKVARVATRRKSNQVEMRAGARLIQVHVDKRCRMWGVQLRSRGETLWLAESWGA